MINESNKPTNPELWSRAKALAKKKFDVYPSAYANGWAAKWYKGKGGGWKSKGKTNESNVSELDRIRQKLYEAKETLKEEVVNARNKGSMTEKEKKERDRIAKGLKGVKSIKGKPDSEKEAKYRYATYLVLKKRGGEKAEKSNKSEKPTKLTKKKKKTK